MSDLTFGNYIALLRVPIVWERVDIKVDKEEFLKILNFARITRNDVMHFAGPLAASSIQALRRLAHFLRDLAERR